MTWCRRTTEYISKVTNATPAPFLELMHNINPPSNPSLHCIYKCSHALQNDQHWKQKQCMIRLFDQLLLLMFFINISSFLCYSVPYCIFSHFLSHKRPNKIKIVPSKLHFAAWSAVFISDLWTLFGSLRLDFLQLQQSKSSSWKDLDVA